jgi:hypothetical protein
MLITAPGSGEPQTHFGTRRRPEATEAMVHPPRERIQHHVGSASGRINTQHLDGERAAPTINQARWLFTSTVLELSAPLNLNQTVALDRTALDRASRSNRHAPFCARAPSWPAGGVSGDWLEVIADSSGRWFTDIWDCARKHHPLMYTLRRLSAVERVGQPPCGQCAHPSLLGRTGEINDLAPRKWSPHLTHLAAIGRDWGVFWRDCASVRFLPFCIAAFRPRGWPVRVGLSHSNDRPK